MTEQLQNSVNLHYKPLTSARWNDLEKLLLQSKVKGRTNNFPLGLDEKLYRRQKQNRFPPEPTALKLPPDALGIIVLVELVKHPSSTPATLSGMLKQAGYEIDADMIENLLEYHGLSKKN